MADLSRPTPEIPEFVNGQIMRQRQLNALPRNLQTLFAGRMGGFRTNKPMAVLQVPSASLLHLAAQPVGPVTYLVDTDGFAAESGTAISQVIIQTAGIYWLEWRVSLAASSNLNNNPQPRLQAPILVGGSNVEFDCVSNPRVRLVLNQAAQVQAAAMVPLDVGTSVRFCAQSVGPLNTSQPSNNQTHPLDTALGGARASVEWVAPLDLRRGAVAL